MKRSILPPRLLPLVMDTGVEHPSPRPGSGLLARRGRALSSVCRSTLLTALSTSKGGALSLTFLLLVSGALLLGCGRHPRGVGKPGQAQAPRVKAEGQKKPTSVLASTNTINSIRVDGDTIWFCTDGGVVRYQKATDSYLRFSKDDGLLSNLTWSAAQQGDELWVGDVGGLTRLNLKTRQAETWRMLGNAAISLVSRVLPTPNGGLCILVEGNPESPGFCPAGLYRFDPAQRTWTHLRTVEDEPSSTGPPLLPEEANLLDQVRKEAQLAEAINQADKRFSFCTATASEGNTTYAGSSEGLFYRVGPTAPWRQTHYQGYPDISALAFDGDSLWVGTADAGVFLFDVRKEETRAFGLPTDLPSNHVLDLVGSDKALWVAYQGGVCCVSLPSLEVESLAEETELPLGNVQALAAGKDTIYLATRTAGLLALDVGGKKLTRILDLTPLGVSAASDLVLGSEELWLSTDQGVVEMSLKTSHPHLFRSDLFLDLEEWERLPIELDSQGGILIARGDQVFRLDPATGKYSVEVSVESSRGISDLWLARSTLYISTIGAGVYSHQLGTSTAVLTQGIGEFVNDLAGAGHTLWIGNAEYEGATVGLQALDLNTGGVKTLTLGDGLPSEDVLALTLYNGQVWAATSGGICPLPAP